MKMYIKHCIAVTGTLDPTAQRNMGPVMVGQVVGQLITFTACKVVMAVVGSKIVFL